MVNISIPTLQIKTSGFNLLDIKTINISILYQNGTINKENSDIEIVNDIFIVFLTQEESEAIKDNGARISLSATDHNNMDVSSRIRIVWVKKGSRSNASVGGSFVSQDVFDQITSGIGIKIEDLENGLSIGGGRVYLDYQDGKYGINTDPDRGADTFIPFKSVEGNSECVIFIDSKYDTSQNEFSTITQFGVWNGKIIEKNPLWSELFGEDEWVFSTEFEKINVEVEEK